MLVKTLQTAAIDRGVVELVGTMEAMGQLAAATRPLECASRAGGGQQLGPKHRGPGPVADDRLCQRAVEEAHLEVDEVVAAGPQEVVSIDASVRQHGKGDRVHGPESTQVGRASHEKR